MKTLKVILVALLIVVLGGGVLGGYYVYAEVKAETRPEIQMESLESYGANIANSLLKNRKLEIPAEILSTIISEQSGVETTCVVSDDNLLKIWFSQELDIIGKADICFSLQLNTYDKATGELVLDVQKIEVGALEVPGFLKPRVLKLARRVSGDQVSISESQARFIIEPFTAEVFNTQMRIGIDTVAIEDGKMYFTLYSDLKI